MSVAQDTGDSKANPNMRIWDAVAVTPPSWTKRVQEGPRSYTTINAYRQIATATRQFGPIGTGWGWEHEWEYHGEGEDTLVVCHLTLWYETRVQAVHVTTAGKLYMGRGDRCRVDDDCYKKILTDALTKALSYLGFNADVYYGRYDDNKYVQAAQAREQAEATGGGGGNPPVNGNGNVVTTPRQQAAMIVRRMGIAPTEVIEALKRTYGVSRMEDLTPEDTEAFLKALRECATLHMRIQEHFGERPATPVLQGWLKSRDDNENLLLVPLAQWRAWVAELDEGGPFAQAHAACSRVEGE